MSPTLPKTVGPHRVEGLLGEGGMGVVYAATSPDGRPIAVKCLRPELLRRSPGAAARFEQEARVRVEHPNIIRPVDAGTDERTGVRYIAFERLEGRPLDAVLEESPRLPLVTALEIGIAVARGLAAAHAGGVLHRDIKPSNLFLCANGTTKILDFGVARVMERDTRLTAEGAVVGTVAYLSPEQARGVDVDGRSDLWALGVTLYEALSGTHPFDRGSALPTMLAIMTHRPMPLHALHTNVPLEVSRVIGQTLSLEREERFANADGLADALQAALETEQAATDETTEFAPLRAATAPASTVNTPSILPGEERLVTLVLAVGLTDNASFRRAIAAQGGLVVWRSSSKALGIFGARTMEGGEAVRAVQAAVTARSAAARIAVASGRATHDDRAGIQGSALSAVEEASAIDCHGVVVSADVAGALGPSMQAHPLTDGWLEVRGAAPLGGSPPPRLEPQTLPLIGRDVEVAIVRRALQRAFRDGRPTPLLLTGPPGIGKTRLLGEAARLLAELPDPPLLLRTRAEPLAAGRRLRLSSRLLRSYAQARGWEGAESENLASRRAVADRLVRDAFAEGTLAAEHGPFFRYLLGATTDDDHGLVAAARRDPKLMERRLALAIGEWLGALAARGPLAVVFEDLHWAHGGTLEVIEDYVAGLDGAVLVIATARPDLEDRVPGFLRGSRAEVLALENLREGDVGELAEAIAGRPLSSSLTAALAERTGGNPLFVEQTVRALLEADELGLESASASLPTSVQAAVQTRLDHLDASDKELCKRGAVVGRPFGAEELRVMEVEQPEMGLRSLAQRGILVRRGRGKRGAAYDFENSIVRDVAYRMVASPLRRALHGQLADYLGTAGAAEGDGADGLERARHLEQAGRLVEAAGAYVSAAMRAASDADSETVLDAGERALALDVPDEPRYALHRAMSEANDALGRLDAQGEQLEAALLLARSDTERAQALSDLAVWESRLGRPARAIERATGALEAASRAGNDSERALALGRRAFAAIYGGSLEAAEADLLEAETLAEGEGPALRARAAAWRGQLAAAQGDLSERRRSFAAAAALYEEAGDHRRAAGARLNGADALNRVGAYAEAEEALRDAITLCSRVASHVEVAYGRLNLGYALLEQGKVAEAREELGAARRFAEDHGDERLKLSVILYEARAQLLSDPAGATATAASLVALVQNQGGIEALARALLASAKLAVGEVETAVQESGEAMRVLGELGGLEEDEGHVYLARVEALEASGQRGDAARLRAHARARLERLASAIEDPDWRRRFLDDVVAHRALLEPDAD